MFVGFIALLGSFDIFVKIEHFPADWPNAKCQKQNVKRLMTMDDCIQFYQLNVIFIRSSFANGLIEYLLPNLFSPAMQPTMHSINA